MFITSSSNVPPYLHQHPTQYNLYDLPGDNTPRSYLLHGNPLRLRDTSFTTNAEPRGDGECPTITTSTFPKERSSQVMVAPAANPSRPEIEPMTRLSTPGFEHLGTYTSNPYENAEVSPQKPEHKSTTPRPRKPRRERPRIDLAPDQPPTTQGRPRARVYVACLQCRTRKIRCDGAKPACYNCSKRSSGMSGCDYDAVPKRRGPDRVPGSRQRLAMDLSEVEGGNPVRRRRRTRTTSDSPAASDEHNTTETHHADIPESSFTHQDIQRLPYLTISDSIRTTTSSSSVVCNPSFNLSNLLPSIPGSGRQLFSQAEDDTNSYMPGVSYEPSLNFSRTIWWDSLISLYMFPHHGRRPTLTSSERHTAIQGITSNIRFVFRESNYFFSFFHLSTFFSNYFYPTKRERIQPSLILALLAIAILWQSSEVGLGIEGRERALRFRDEAQGALDASFNAGWIDETLAQAAWLLAMFEVCPHPRHSMERSSSSLVILDSIIRSLSLTAMDADNPKTSIFLPGAVAAVTEPKGCSFPVQSLSNHAHKSATDSTCPCNIMTLGVHSPESSCHAPLWSFTPAWGETWSETDIMKESCRRLAWSSMILAAGHASYVVAYKSRVLDLFISDPSNYALLFSAEAIADSPGLLTSCSPKGTVWAIHDRVLLLWHSCTRMRNNIAATDLEKAKFAMKTWLEADSLEAILNKHTCGLERAFIFQAREYIFNTRMCISYEFQRYIPLASAVSGLFHRDKAKEWLTHHANVAERFMLGLHTITGHSTNNTLARRPFFAFWFMGQIARALSLWECDNTLTIAIDVCKALLPALDYLTALWPCPEQRHRYEALRKQLNDACYIARVNPPPPANLDLPSPAASGTLAYC